MKKLTTISLTVAAATLALAPQASAHKLAQKPAMKAITAEAQKVAKSTRADRVQLKSCKRLNGHAWRCSASFTYRADDMLCDVSITVSAKRHKSRRLTRALGATTCV